MAGRGATSSRGTASRSSDPRPGPAGTSRRHGGALEDAILGAAWTLLAESGFTAVTFEAVAAAAQTSRSVVYRRWRSRDELIEAAVAWQWSRERTPIPDTGSLRGDVLALMTTSVAAHSQLQVVASLQLMSYFSQSGSSLEEFRTSVLSNETLAMPTMLMRAQQRGEVDVTGVPQRVLNLPVEILRGRVLTSREAPTRDECEAIIDEIYFPLLRAYGAVSG